MNHATKVIAGFGALYQVGAEAEALGAKKVLIITDEFMVQSEALNKIKKSLSEAEIDYEIYRDVKAEPQDDDCAASARLAKKIKADAIIGFGGGNCMDQCKASAALVTNGGTCRDWDGIPLKENKLPIICIPITAGTGNEATFAAVVTGNERKCTMILLDHDKLVPNVAIVDAETTLTIPPSIMASTGVDALTCSIEAGLINTSEEDSESIALHAIELISTNLKDALRDDRNVMARDSIQIGSVMAAVASVKSGTGVVNAISEAIGKLYGTPKGICNPVFLPYMMEYYLPTAVEGLAVIAERMGIDPQGKTKKAVALEGIQTVKDLNATLNIPKLRNFNYIKKESFGVIAKMAVKAMSQTDNWEIKIDEDGCISILKAAYAGE